MTEEFFIEQRGRVLVCTLNNPAMRNALSPEIYQSAFASLEEAENDPGIGAVVYTGAGGFFCAGGNLNRLKADRRRPKSEQRARVELLNRWVDKMRRFPKPIIAAVEGAAAGAGFSLALGSDLIVSAEDAVFAMSYVKVALNPDGGGSAFICRGLPHQLAAELMFEGGKISPQRLHSLGIVNRICGSGQALETAVTRATKLADGPTVALGRIKSLLEKGYPGSVLEQLEAEANYMNDAVHHPEAWEGIEAFLEKRKPVFPRE